MMELIRLVTSNYFSILLYNSKVWRSPVLKENLKLAIYLASAKALKVCNRYCDPFLSFLELHELTTGETPSMYCNCKGAILLYRTFNATVVILNKYNKNDM